MNYKLALLFALLMILTEQVNAQLGVVYHNAPHCIFLKGNKELSEFGLNYYDVFEPSIMLDDKALGFSIDRNLKGDKDGKYLSFISYYTDSKNNPQRMTINLYFKTLPDTINYYLKIIDFKSNQIININIPSDKNSLKRLRKINTGTDKGYAYDITDLVFPRK